MNPLGSAPDPPDDTPWELPIGDILDLHSIPPRDARAVLEAWLEEVEQRQFPAIRIIHGRGIGVQREMVRTVLARTPFVLSFADAPAEAGGWGSTIATCAASNHRKTMPTESEFIRTSLEAVVQDACQLTATLSDAQWNWRASPKAWSIGQCIEHLAVTDRLYAAKIKEAIADGRARSLTGDGPFRYNLLDRFFVWSVSPPVYVRFSAPKPFRPAPEPRSVPRQSTLNDYFASNATLQQLAQEADGLDFVRIRLGSPASDNMRFALGTAFHAMVGHSRRHLWQARKIMAHQGFPKA